VKELKFFIFLEIACNLFARKERLLWERLGDLTRFKFGKVLKIRRSSEFRLTFFGYASEVEGCEVREPFEETRKKRDGLIGDCKGGSETVADGEKLFGDEREELQSVIVALWNFKMHSHNSSGKHEHASAIILV